MNQSIAVDIKQVMPLAVASGLFVSLCTVQQPDGLFIGAGQPSGNYTNVTGLVNIACMDAPLSVGSVVAGEERMIAEILSRQLRHVLLNGYYPQATPDNQIPTNWIAIVDGIKFNVLGVEHDSQFTQTRLKLQLATL